jgi:hypothetical protein
VPQSEMSDIYRDISPHTNIGCFGTYCWCGVGLWYFWGEDFVVKYHCCEILWAFCCEILLWSII